MTAGNDDKGKLQEILRNIFGDTSDKIDSLVNKGELLEVCKETLKNTSDSANALKEISLKVLQEELNEKVYALRNIAVGENSSLDGIIGWLGEYAEIADENGVDKKFKEVLSHLRNAGFFAQDHSMFFVKEGFSNNPEGMGKAIVEKAMHLMEDGEECPIKFIKDNLYRYTSDKEMVFSPDLD